MNMRSGGMMGLKNRRFSTLMIPVCVIATLLGGCDSAPMKSSGSSDSTAEPTQGKRFASVNQGAASAHAESADSKPKAVVLTEAERDAQTLQDLRRQIDLRMADGIGSWVELTAFFDYQIAKNDHPAIRPQILRMWRETDEKRLDVLKARHRERKPGVFSSDDVLTEDFWHYHPASTPDPAPDAGIIQTRWTRYVQANERFWKGAGRLGWGAIRGVTYPTHKWFGMPADYYYKEIAAASLDDYKSYADEDKATMKGYEHLRCSIRKLDEYTLHLSARETAEPYPYRSIRKDVDSLVERLRKERADFVSYTIWSVRLYDCERWLWIREWEKAAATFPDEGAQIEFCTPEIRDRFMTNYAGIKDGIGNSKWEALKARHAMLKSDVSGTSSVGPDAWYRSKGACD